MQQFVVPQFIDVEDKIIGPITTRQFIILLATGFVVFLSYRLSDFSLFLVLLVVSCLFGGVLAFARVNGRPFHYFLLNLVQTIRRPGLRVWRKHADISELKQMMTSAATLPVAPAVVSGVPLSSSRLSELALVVDTGGVYRGENESRKL